MSSRTSSALTAGDSPDCILAATWEATFRAERLSGKGSIPGKAGIYG